MEQKGGFHMDYRYKLDHSAIARQIRSARRQAGLTQAELAEQIDISTNAVAKLENELMTASLQTLINIANVLHLDMNQLFLSQPDAGTDSQDQFLLSLIRELEPTDKEFLLHVITGLKLYHSNNEKKP